MSYLSTFVLASLSVTTAYVVWNFKCINILYHGLNKFPCNSSWLFDCILGSFVKRRAVQCGGQIKHSCPPLPTCTCMQGTKHVMIMLYYWCGISTQFTAGICTTVVPRRLLFKGILGNIETNRYLHPQVTHSQSWKKMKLLNHTLVVCGHLFSVLGWFWSRSGSEKNTRKNKQTGNSSKTTQKLRRDDNKQLMYDLTVLVSSIFIFNFWEWLPVLKPYLPLPVSIL